jgi:acid stress chaperone HdeB
MLRKILALAGMAIALAGQAKAEVVDLSTVKCSELSDMSAEDVSYLLIWIHGYYGGKAGDKTIDLESLGEAGKRIGEACAENPDLGLLTVTDRIAAGAQ